MRELPEVSAGTAPGRGGTLTTLQPECCKVLVLGAMGFERGLEKPVEKLFMRVGDS